MASNDTLWLPATEIAVYNLAALSVDVDTPCRTGLYAKSALSALFFVDSQNAPFFVSMERPSRACLDAGCLLTLLAN